MFDNLNHETLAVGASPVTLTLHDGPPQPPPPLEQQGLMLHAVGRGAITPTFPRHDLLIYIECAALAQWAEGTEVRVPADSIKFVAGKTVAFLRRESDLCQAEKDLRNLSSARNSQLPRLFLFDCSDRPIATSVTGDVIVVDIMADGEGELEASSCEKSRKRLRNDENGKENGLSGRTEAANVNWCKYHVLTENERDEIFCQFYKIGDYNAQNAFLFGLISRQECSGIYLKKRKNENSSRRHVSFIYRVKDSHGQLNRVCSKGFCDVFGISKRRLSTTRGDRKVNISQSNGNDSEDEEEGCNTSKVSPLLIAEVLRMGTEDFKNFHNAASLIVRNQKNALDRKMPLRKIAILRIQATKPGILQYKTKYSDICPWEEVQVFYKPAGRPNKGKNLAMPSQETLRKIFLPSNMECFMSSILKCRSKYFNRKIQNLHSDSNDENRYELDIELERQEGRQTDRQTDS
ncbi:hypothetical protein ANN_14435 [Periplaneta americana]|uniref:Uncharacterized protein n=1 Tax=Periplaneta americana TaxID=6978 RepID=A0ABQ8SWA8_PERAM|nr:hypothetical protein ANN_14435 [Periplaneta americana]